MKVELGNTIDLADAFSASEPPRRESESDFGSALEKARQRSEPDADRTERAESADRQDDDSTTDEVKNETEATSDTVDGSTVPVLDDAVFVVAPNVAAGVSDAVLETASPTELTGSVVAAVVPDEGPIAPRSTAVDGAAASTAKGLPVVEANTPPAGDPSAPEGEAKLAPARTAQAQGDEQGVQLSREAVTQSGDKSRIGAVQEESKASGLDPKIGQYFARAEDARGGRSSFYLVDGNEPDSVRAASLGKETNDGLQDSIAREPKPAIEAARSALPAAEPQRAAPPSTGNSGAPNSVSSSGAQVTTVDVVSGGVESTARATTAVSESTVRVDNNDQAMIAKRLQRALRGALRRGDGHIRIRLDPPELGRVDIKVQMEKNQLGVHMEVETEEVRSAIAKHLHELEELLEAYGRGGEVSVDLRNSSSEDQSDRTPSGSGVAESEELTDSHASEALVTEWHLGQQLDLTR